jgi:tRNA U34 5-methylaminomethyl-2-thiouridine-forming methyltransferase MnmC
LINAVKSEDGSFTAFSSEYNEHYHSTRDGALNESLYKHVIPALLHVKDKAEIVILDICFGLGFNTLATLYYLQKNSIQKKVTIISPELDAELITSLKDFQYPEIFAPFLHIIKAISDTHEYQDESLHVKVIVGDARKYLLTSKDSFDIVYQDAFSPSANPMLWTKEYFGEISKLIKDNGILTTYSMALKTRLALYENGFNIYINSGEGYRDATLASKAELNFPLVDMKHKILCNPDVKPLHDITLLNFFMI